MSSKNLKIIICDGSFKTTSFINRLVSGLTKSNRVYIFGFNETLAFRLKNVHYIPLGSNQNKPNFVITTLSFAIQSRNPRLLLSTIIKLFKGHRQTLQKQNLLLALKKIKPDIIHLQWTSIIPWFEEVLSQQKIPVVLSQRGFHSNVRPFVDETNVQYLKKWYPKMAGFHSVSQAISKVGDKVYATPTKIDKVVYTGIDLESIPFAENYEKPEKIQLLSVGRPHWKKGYHYALKACKLLENKNLPFHYTIIGGLGNEELIFMLNDLDLAEHITLLGNVKQGEVFTAMRTASLLLLPSIEEGIANVVIEAMAIGLPVISTDCGGMSEAIEHNKEGWIVPIRNTKAMAASILNFNVMSVDTIETIRLNARNKVLQRFSINRMINDMNELYKEVSLKKMDKIQ